MTTSSQLPFGVASYSFPVSCGYAKRKDKANLAHPMNAYALADLAAANNLSSIEIPLDHMLPELNERNVDSLKTYLDARNLALLVDTGVVNVNTLRTVLPLAKRAGAKVVRAVLSTILEGNRAAIRESNSVANTGWGAVMQSTNTAANWGEYLNEIRRRLIEILPVLKEHGLVLALENHQDCTSDELLALCEIDPKHIGVTLDVVNPLAVCEEPFAFARKLGAHIYDVHIKDYTVRATPQGYRLVRAAIGQGSMDWRAMLTLLSEIAPHAMWHIELAAIYARHIRVFEPTWWDSFAPRPMQDIAAALRFMHERAVPDNVAWQTPWEQNGDDAHTETYAYELAQFAHSVAYLKNILK